MAHVHVVGTGLVLRESRIEQTGVQEARLELRTVQGHIRLVLGGGRRRGVGAVDQGQAKDEASEERYFSHTGLPSLVWYATHSCIP